MEQKQINILSLFIIIELILCRIRAARSAKRGEIPIARSKILFSLKNNANMSLLVLLQMTAVRLRFH